MARRETTPLPTLRRRLAQAEARVSKLERVTSPGDEVAKSFHLGTVGGSGRGVRRLNARKAASLDKIIDAAVELPKARAKVNELRARIANAEAPTPALSVTEPPAKPKRQPRGLNLTPEDAARLLTLGRWVLYGAADDPIPFPDVTQLECERATRLYPRLRAAQNEAA